MSTKIRAYKPEDHNLVISTFLKGIYYGNEFYGMIDKNVFMANYKYIAEAMITQNTVRVACLHDDEDTIVGYSLISKDGTTIHWAYVKKDWRAKFGTFKSLLPNTITTYSHFSTQGLQIIKKCFPNLTFNPFKIQ